MSASVQWARGGRIGLTIALTHQAQGGAVTVGDPRRAVAPFTVGSPVEIGVLTPGGDRTRSNSMLGVGDKVAADRSTGPLKVIP